MIFCNGQPKCGTNLLQKICGAIGLTDAEVSMIGLSGFKPKMTASKIVAEDEKIRVPLESRLKIDNTKFCHAHVTSANAPLLEGHKMLVAIRDPRDAAVSFVRWQEKRRGVPANEDALVDLLAHGYPPIRPPEAPLHSHTYVQFTAWFGAWMLEPGALCLEFRSLWKPETIERIGRYLDWPVPDPEKVAAQIYGNGKLVNGRPVYKTLSSWSGRHSRWRDWWTPRVDEVWHSINGPALLRVMGYG